MAYVAIIWLTVALQNLSIFSVKTEEGNGSHFRFAKMATVTSFLATVTIKICSNFVVKKKMGTVAIFVWLPVALWLTVAMLLFENGDRCLFFGYRYHNFAETK